jgi:hypothetical protein
MLAGGALAVGLVNGCAQPQKNSGCSTCQQCSGSSVVMKPVTITPATPNVVAAPAETHAIVSPYLQSPMNLPPAVERFTPSAPLSSTTTSVSEKPNDTVEAAVTAPVRRRSFADITADSRFAHAENYGWLVGEVQYSHVKKTWRLRYASVDEDDRYGGSVTLDGGTHTGELKEGQIVKIEGKLMDPESREVSPAYQVFNISAVAK